MKVIINHVIAPLVEPRLPAGIDVVHIDQQGVADGELADAEAFFSWWTPVPALTEVLAAAPHIRWIQSSAAGVDWMLIPPIIERDLLLTKSSGAQAKPIAEFVMMLILNHAKRPQELQQQARAQNWYGLHGPSAVHLTELSGKTVVILGLGTIGREVAQRAAAFELRVLGSRRNPAPMAHVDRVVGVDHWRDLLPEADYLVLSTPLTEETRGMLDGEALALLKPNAYIINIARGELIDTPALIAALSAGAIAGAALDALPEEPLPPEHPLWDAPHVLITPHVAWSSPDTSLRTVELFLTNLARFCSGEPLINVVDKAAGY